MFLVGICSHENDYRLCWALNKALGLTLARCTDLEGSSHARFEHVDPDLGVTWSLVSNSGPEGLLIKEQPRTDYFLMVDEELGVDPDELLGRVKNIEFILTAFPLDLDGLRGGHKLLR